MFKKSLIAASLVCSAFASTATFAGVNTGLGFSNVNLDNGSEEYSLKTMNIHLGYSYELSKKLSLTPEVSLGLGIDDDSVGETFADGSTATLNVEVDKVTSFAIRGEYQVSPKITLFVRPVYSKVKMTGELLSDGVVVPGASNVNLDSDWDLGAGLGVDVKVAKNTALSFSYDYSEHDILDTESDFETLSVSMRYSF